MVVEASPDAPRKISVLKLVLIGAAGFLIFILGLGTVIRATTPADTLAIRDCWRESRNATTESGRLAIASMCKGLEDAQRERLLANSR
jgi:hypothetical protein